MNNLDTKNVERRFSDELKIARKNKKLSQESLSRQSGIRLSHIKHLEEENFDMLPANVYVRGYLNNICLALSLDPKIIYDKYLDSKENLASSMASKEPKLKSDLNIITPRSVSFLFFVIALFSLAFYFSGEVSNLLGSPYIKIKNPSQDMIVSDSKVELSGYVSAGADLTVNGALVYVDSSGNFNDILFLSPGVNIITVEAKNKFGKSTKDTRKIFLKQSQEFSEK